MIVDDSFSRLTTRTIVHDSSSVSCLGNFGQIAVKPFILLQVCLTGGHLVFTFLRGKNSGLAAIVTLLARLPVNYSQLSRTSLAV